jgi:hypothetical protein
MANIRVIAVLNLLALAAVTIYPTRTAFGLAIGDSANIVLGDLVLLLVLLLSFVHWLIRRACVRLRTRTPVEKNYRYIVVVLASLIILQAAIYQSPSLIATELRFFGLVLFGVLVYYNSSSLRRHISGRILAIGLLLLAAIDSVLSPIFAAAPLRVGSYLSNNGTAFIMPMAATFLLWAVILRVPVFGERSGALSTVLCLVLSAFILTLSVAYGSRTQVVAFVFSLGVLFVMLKRHSRFRGLRGHNDCLLPCSISALLTRFTPIFLVAVLVVTAFLVLHGGRSNIIERSINDISKILTSLGQVLVLDFESNREGFFLINLWLSALSNWVSGPIYSLAVGAGLKAYLVDTEAMATGMYAGANARYENCHLHNGYLDALIGFGPAILYLLLRMLWTPMFVFADPALSKLPRLLRVFVMSTTSYAVGHSLFEAATHPYLPAHANFYFVLFFTGLAAGVLHGFAADDLHTSERVPGGKPLVGKSRL